MGNGENGSSTTDVRTWLTAQVATLLPGGGEGIRPDERLSEYGLDSVYALALVGEIEDHWQVTLDPTVVWDHPTIAELADLVVRERAR